MRADRLLSILLLLQPHRRLTARELAARLEVSERTIHRDMDALSAAGVPVYATRGANGGWLLAEGYRTNLTGLTEAEVQALFLTTPPQLLADLGLQRAAEAALRKLLAALPSAGRRDAEHARGRVHVDTSGWRRAEEAVPCLPVLQEAVWRERRLRLSYARGDGGAVERELDPLGLVAKGGIWYLVGAVEGQPRTYRVSRVREAALLDEPCVRPPDFDLAAFWAQSSAGFVAALPRYPATVRLAAELFGQLYGLGGYVQVERTSPPDADGRVTVDLRFQLEEEACRFVLGFGAQIEAVRPPELRALVARRAAEVAAFYAQHDVSDVSSSMR